MRLPLRPRRPFGLEPLELAVLLWSTAFLIVVVLLLAGRAPTLSYRVYEAAGRHWQARQPLYEDGTLEGFQYFPQAALLLSGFARWGSPLGGVLWRAAGWIALASGLWRILGALVPAQRRTGFLVASALTIGPAIGSLTNGQANLALAAFTLHASVELSARRWWRASWVLVIGLALKPLLLVLLLLAAVLHRPLRWRLGVALGALFVMPWLFADSTYVVAQYLSCLHKLGLSANAGPLYENLCGLFASLGRHFPGWLCWPAALGTLGLSLRVQRQVREPHASLLIAAFACSYLVLFNPRTQSTSYVLTGSIAAVLAALKLIEQRPRSASALILLCGVWTVNYNWSGFVGIEYWLKPLGGLAFAALLLRSAFAAPLGWRRANPPRGLFEQHYAAHAPPEPGVASNH
jgi:hypothetical protein